MSAEEELLAAVVAGELPQDDPRAQALFAERPELRDEVESLRALGSRLAGAGAYERESIEAQEDPGDALREAARQAVLNSQGGAFGPASRRRWLGLVGAAAAGITAVALWPRPDRHPEDHGELLLSQSGDFQIFLDGDEEAPESLRWDAVDLSGGASFRVLIVSQDGESRSVADGLEKNEWSPDDPAVWDGWTRIEVRVEEVNGSRRASASLVR